MKNQIKLQKNVDKVELNVDEAERNVDKAEHNVDEANENYDNAFSEQTHNPNDINRKNMQDAYEQTNITKLLLHEHKMILLAAKINLVKEDYKYEKLVLKHIEMFNTRNVLQTNVPKEYKSDNVIIQYSSKNQEELDSLYNQLRQANADDTQIYNSVKTYETIWKTKLNEYDRNGNTDTQNAMTSARTDFDTMTSKRTESIQRIAELDKMISNKKKLIQIMKKSYLDNKIKHTTAYKYKKYKTKYLELM